MSLPQCPHFSKAFSRLGSGPLGKAWVKPEVFNLFCLVYPQQLVEKQGILWLVN